jgi:hypothetical protein
MRAEKQLKPKEPLPEGTRHWIVVADHTHAHVYEKTRRGINEVGDKQACCSQPFPQEGTGREDVFLSELATWLDTAEREQAFDRLVLIAPPAALSQICALMGEGEETRICDGLDQEVEKVTDDEVEDHLTEVVWH